MNLRNHILAVVLVPAVLIIVFLSYYRFMVDHDYMVTYEGACDPATQDCYIGCDDDECTEEYYYSTVEKYAADVYAQCGPDITDCETASSCVAEDRACSVTYCDIETEGDLCETLTEAADETEPMPEEAGDEEPEETE